jgi:hypothetical protein
LAHQKAGNETFVLDFTRLLVKKSCPSRGFSGVVSTTRSWRLARLSLQMDSHKIAFLDCWIVGLLDCWIVGLLDCWIVGLLDCWIVGLLDPCLKYPLMAKFWMILVWDQSFDLPAEIELATTCNIKNPSNIC